MKRVLGLFIVAICSLFIGINAKALTMDEVINEIEKGEYVYQDYVGSIDFTYDQDTLTFTMISDSLTFETNFTYDENTIFYNLDYEVSSEESILQTFMDTIMAYEIINDVFSLSGISGEINELDLDNMTYEENGIEIISDVLYEGENGRIQGMESFRININDLNPIFLESPLKIEIVNVSGDGIQLDFETTGTESSCTLYRAQDGSEIAIGIAEVDCNGTYLDNTIEESGTYSYYITYSSDFFTNSETVSTVYNLADYGLSSDVTVDTEVTTETTDGLENPNTGDFMPIAILLGMLGASIILIVNLNKKNKFKKI